MSIYDLINRAQQLREETKLDSVSPERVGALCEDTLKYINEFQLLASSPALHKIYASVSAMQSDAMPTSDLTGKTLKPGQLVVIVPASQTDATAGDVYRYDGPSGNTSAWTFVSKIGAIPADAELNATSENPVQNKAVTDRLNELSEEIEIQIEDLQNTKIDKEADDYYPQLSVGTADNLAGVDEVASEFNFRRSGGGAIADGVARVQSIKGNSVVWNQLLKSFSSWNLPQGGEILNGGKGAKWLASKRSGALNASSNVFAQFASHKYLLMANVKTTSKNVGLGMYYTNSPKVKHSGSGQWEILSVILKSYDGSDCCYLTDTSTSGYSDIEIDGYICIDLTKKFGSGNEPNTIDEFYQRMPMGIGLYAYNEGEVISMRAEGIKSVGRNQWNEQWELGGINSSDGKDYEATNRIKSGYIRILANTKYYFKKPQGIVTLLYFYDENKSYVGFLDPLATSGVGGVFTTMNASYMRFVVAQETYHHDICLNFSDTDFNGQYAPYMEAREDLSLVAKYFPNGMRSTNKSCYDEFRYIKQTNKREAVQRIAEVDLGTIDYSRGKFGDIYAFSCQIPQANKMVGLANMTCGIYVARAVSAAALNNMEMRGDDRVAYPNSLYIRNDAYTDTASFKAAMSGVMLYYELAEPIVTEIAEKDFNLDYKVENNGTEQAIAEGKSSALSADITYGFNAVGLIKQLRTLVEAMAAKLANL